MPVPRATPPAQWGQQPGYYPPQRHQVVVKEKRGCLSSTFRAIWLIIGLFILLIIVIVVVAASTANKPGQGSKSHPAAADVTVGSCTVDQFGFGQAAGMIVNHSSGKSDYTFTVQFIKNGIAVAQGAGLENDILPQQTAEWTVQGDNQITGPVTCQVTGVLRLAAP